MAANHRLEHEVIREVLRALAAIAVPIVAMGALGSLAMAAVEFPLVDVEACVVSFIVGAVIGFITLPIVAPCLLVTRLRYSLPLVYGVAAVVVVIYAGFFSPNRTGWSPPIDAAIPAVATVCFLSVVSVFLIRRRHPAAAGICPTCGYILAGLKDRGCPECGWQRVPLHQEERSVTDHE